MIEVKRYLSNTNVNAPFFLACGDENYESTKNQLVELGLKPVRLSDCCSAPDKPPSLDKLFEEIDFADIDGSSGDKKIVILGLGEYLAFRGEDEAFKRLDSLKDKKVGNARVVLLLRGVSSIIQRIQQAEAKRSVERYIYFTSFTNSFLSVAVCPSELDLPASIGIKGMLFDFENGKSIVSVKTNADFGRTMFAVRKINSAYDGVKHIIPTFNLAESFGTAEQWREFLSAVTTAGGKFNKLFLGFDNRPENLITLCLNGTNYKNWLYFIALKLKSSEIDNPYLKYVAEITSDFADLKKNIVGAISDIDHTDSRFDEFYTERKLLIGRLLAEKKLSEADIAAFVSDNRRNPVEGLYKLTDLTLTERKELVALFATIATQDVIKRVNLVYSFLADYLWKYTFTDPKSTANLNVLLTDYFNSYKWQKVTNNINDDFLSQVESLAKERKYNGLRTRTEVLNGVLEKENTHLYWIDALGVEFLGFVQKICEQKGLSLQIHIAQADLPTITAANNNFYVDWVGKKEKEKHLDEIKHKESGGYNYETENLPIHLAEELDVIANLLEKIATELALHKYKKALIVSDHGASRLAVINGQEEKYDADEKGKHSGRICKRPAGYAPTSTNLPFATESSDGQYLVLANYGRFKGSRKANVEVHGGATLEEVVVPIIEIMLSSPDTSIELLNSDRIYSSFRKPLEFTLFSKAELQSVRVTIKGQSIPYIAKKTDKNHYHVITDIKRGGKYSADVFDGDSLIGKLTIDVKSETQKKSDSDDFDNLFN